jgi:hypothetical protein
MSLIKIFDCMGLNLNLILRRMEVVAKRCNAELIDDYLHILTRNSNSRIVFHSAEFPHVGVIVSLSITPTLALKQPPSSPRRFYDNGFLATFLGSAG